MNGTGGTLAELTDYRDQLSAKFCIPVRLPLQDGLEYSPYLSSRVDDRVYLKLECLQHSGNKIALVLLKELMNEHA